MSGLELVKISSNVHRSSLENTFLSAILFQIRTEGSSMDFPQKSSCLITQSETFKHYLTLILVTTLPKTENHLPCHRKSSLLREGALAWMNKDTNSHDLSIIVGWRK